LIERSTRARLGLRRPVLDSQSRDTPEVVEVVRHDREAPGERGRANQDVLHIDHLPPGPEVRHDVACDDPIVRSDAKDLDPGEDLPLDS